IEQKVGNTGSVAGDTVPLMVADEGARKRFVSTSNTDTDLASPTRSAVTREPGVIEEKLPSFAIPPGSFTARCPSTIDCWLTLALLRARNARSWPWQTPFWQMSMTVHRFPSSHAAPFASTGLLQPLRGLHRSSVHEFPSTQLSGVPGWQPANGRQVSSPLQTL